MTSPSALVDTIALLLFQNFKEGMETGRIANMDSAQIEVEAAIVELNRRCLLEESAHTNDLIGKLILDVGSLHQKVAKCESQLAEIRSLSEALEEVTSQIAACTKACSLPVDQQQKEGVKVPAATDEIKASISTAPPPCVAPAPSPTNPTVRPAPSRMAVVSFPGEARTVTIHPPNSPNYQSIIRDEKGDVIISLKGPKPLQRQGAFRGPLEEINWRQITHVCGRGPNSGGPLAVPPVPRWPDRSQSSPSPAPSRALSEIIARQRQLSMSLHTDPFGRVLPPDYPLTAKSPSLPTAKSSSSVISSQESQASSVKLEDISPDTTPPSPSTGRGKKRARNSGKNDGMPSTTETREGALQEPTTPTPTPEGPAPRKKRRSLATGEHASGTVSLPRAA